MRRLLTRVVREMVRSRALSVPTEAAYAPGASAAWEELHSNEIVGAGGQAGRYTAFRHNIIFDYAASALLLDDTSGALLSFLDEEPARAVFLRPSLDYFLARLWSHKRETVWRFFWAMFGCLRRPDMRLVARVLPAGVIAREARNNARPRSTSKTSQRRVPRMRRKRPHGRCKRCEHTTSGGTIPGVHSRSQRRARPRGGSLGI